MITINPVIPSELLPVNIIEATAWEVSTQPVFNIENYIVGRMALNTVNKTTAEFAIDDTKLISKDLFIRVQYKFTDGTVSDFSDYFQFEIPDFIGYMFTSNIRIPDLAAYLQYTPSVDGTSIDGSLYIKGNAFRDFNTMTEHAYTYWKVQRDDGNVVFSKTAHFLTNPEELYEVNVPINLLEDQISYTINCTYKGKNDAVSGEAAYKFQSFLSSSYFKTTIMSEFVSGRISYFKIEPKTTKFQDINLQLFDSTGALVLEMLSQETVYPKFNIPTTLLSSEQYTLKGYLTLTDGGITPVETIATFIIRENVLYTITGQSYPEKVSLVGNIETGINNTLSSIQLEDGIILIGNNVTKTINKYRFVNGKLLFIGVALTLEDSENIGILYLNVMKMYNGKIVINFGYNTKFSTNNGNVFRMYNYSPVTQELTLVNQLRFSNMGNGTATSTSMVTSPQGDIYFIPSYHLDANKVRDSLKLYKIDGSTFTIEKTINLPFVAKQNVSLVPTKDQDKYLIIGGSENRYEVDGQMTWKRENDIIYTLNSANDTILETGINLYNEADGYSIDPYYYSLQGYVRADGKVVLFNSVIDGPKKDYQNMFIIDTDTKSVTEVVIDVPDRDVYKSTVRLNDGSFLRISTTFNITNKVLYYPSGNISITVPGEEIYTGKLVVPVGQTKYLTSINFDKIVVEGTSPDNTGTLILLLGEKEFVYTYGTILLGRSQTMTAEEKAKYSQIVIVNRTDVRILDTL